jgi:AAA domain
MRRTDSSPDYYDHPLFQPHGLFLYTPQIQQLEETILRWLWTGQTGGVVMGASRHGKTTALLYLLGRLKNRAGQKIATHLVSIPEKDTPTITSVHRNLCLSAQLPVKNVVSDKEKAQFLNFLLDLTATYGCKQIVLLVDEMHHLRPKQFEAFIEYETLLRPLKYGFMVVFTGNNPQCKTLLERIDTDQTYDAVRGRFFRQQTRFKGLCSEKDVRACLKQYDTLRFPEEGSTYTGYFLPDAVKQGWQLASQSRQIWAQFREYKKTLNVSSWGMQYFVAAINTLLIDYLPKYGVEHFSDEMFEQCIKASGLVPSSVQQR